MTYVCPGCRRPGSVSLGQLRGFRPARMRLSRFRCASRAATRVLRGRQQ